MSIEFKGWPKIGRWANAHVIATEKLDGTNAAVGILEDGTVYAQSRTRIITPNDDNFGFARWVEVNADTLREDLGQGLHFGEWYGEGIQRKYGMTEKRFALFNSYVWGPKVGHFLTPRVDVVPVLYSGPLDTEEIDRVAAALYATGSAMVPGWMKPEGLVVYETISRASWKLTDAAAPKGPKDEHGNAG